MQHSVIDILKSFLYGLRMDASMAGYLCAIPFLLFIASWLFPKISFKILFIKYYTYLLICLTALFTVIDINIYKEWGTKLNYRAIDFFLKSPSEALASSASSPLFLTFITAVLLIIAGIYIFNNLPLKIIYRFSPKFFLPKAILSICILGLTFIAIRGSLDVAPMNASMVYYSDQQLLNHSALNTNWILTQNILRSTNKNPYVYFDPKKASSLKKSLFKASSNNFTNIITTKKPNIVLIIMESFTADLVEELGGSQKNNSPGFSNLIKEGLLFNSIYASGDRTDKGLVAILSGFPSQAISSIIKENDKQEHLPSLMNVFNKINYQTSFFYGGNAEFSNFKSYLLNQGTKKIIDASNFNTEEIKSNWGAFDEVTFNKHIHFLNKEREPFFASILTLSNHEPFMLPEKSKFGNNSLKNKFKSTSFYADSCLYDYILKAKKQKWYKNTLFVIIADHGHRLPAEKYEIYEPQRFHIPLLFLGGALNNSFKNKTIEKTGSQTDVASIILNQINLPDTAFQYSKNLLNPAVNGFGFYNWDNGFAYIDDKEYISYDAVSKKEIEYKSKTSKKYQKKNAALDKAKALMQSVYTDFFNY